jgi:hypothetical protein
MDLAELLEPGSQDVGGFVTAALAEADHFASSQVATSGMIHVDMRTRRRRVTSADVAGLVSLGELLADVDHRMGGGHAQETLMQYVVRLMDALLAGICPDHTRASLLEACARLHNVMGFMCADTKRYRCAETYLVRAYELAKECDSHVLQGHILADSAVLAHHDRRHARAMALADAAVRAARRGPSRTVLARCHAVRARTFAGTVQETASLRDLIEAERSLGSGPSSEDPAWTGFFTARQLAAESLYVRHELGRTREAISRTGDALANQDDMSRRRVLVAAALARCHVPPSRSLDAQARKSRHPNGDLDLACHILRDALPSMAALRSRRAAGAVLAARRELARYADVPVVRELEDEFRMAPLTR